MSPVTSQINGVVRTRNVSSTYQISVSHPTTVLSYVQDIKINIHIHSSVVVKERSCSGIASMPNASSVGYLILFIILSVTNKYISYWHTPKNVSK